MCVSLSEGRGYVFWVVFPVSKTETTPRRSCLFVEQKLLTIMPYCPLSWLRPWVQERHLGTYAGSEGRDQGQTSWDTPKFQAVAGKEPDEESDMGQQIRWEKTRKESVRNTSFSR